MKFTKDVEYAFISIISIKNSEGPVSAKTIAVENNLSFELVSKVLQHLASVDEVKARKGPKGGYILNKKLNDISLSNMVSLFKGNNDVVNCASDKSKCRNSDKCTIRNGMTKIQGMWDRILANLSMEELIRYEQ